MSHVEEKAAYSRVDFVYNTAFENLHAPIELAFWTVFDFPAWQGYESVEHISGPVGGEGELAAIRKYREEPGWQQKYCKTVKLDPTQQIVWRVYTGPGQVGPDGWENEFDVTVDYRFEAVGPDRTTIRQQVIKEFFVPSDDPAELARVRKAEYRHQVEIMEHIGPRLIELLERKVKEARA